MRTDPLALIRGVTEFVTVIYGPAVTFALPDVKVEAYRRSVLHLNFISAVDGSTLNWCEQHGLRQLMSEYLLFAEISIRANNSAKRKRVEEAMDLGQDDYHLPGTDRMLTDVAMVPPILMAGIKSTGYKSKKSDRTLTGATLEMEILSQCGESTVKDFKPSSMNHGKGSVAGKLVPVEYNRLTMSETVSIDEPAGGNMEMLEYRNSARGYVMALEDKSAMEGYLKTMLQGTTLKQKAYGTLASFEMQAEDDRAISEPSMESSGVEVL